MRKIRPAATLAPLPGCLCYLSKLHRAVAFSGGTCTVTSYNKIKMQM